MLRLTIKLTTLTILFITFSLCAQNKNSENDTKDLAAIEKLHQKEQEASLKNDFKTLRSLIDDNAVVMPNGQDIVEGKDALDASFQTMKAAMSDYVVLKYKMDFQEIKVLGNYAYEWGTITGASRKKGSDEVYNTSYKIMRILKKEPNGEWKVYRSMWNSDPDNS